MQGLSNAATSVRSNWWFPIVISGNANLSPYITKDSVGRALAQMLHCDALTYSEIVAHETRGDKVEQEQLILSGRREFAFAEFAERRLIQFMDTPKLCIAVSAIGEPLSHCCAVVENHLHVHIDAIFESRVQAKLCAKFDLTTSDLKEKVDAKDPVILKAKKEIGKEYKASDDMLLARAEIYHGAEDTLFKNPPHIILDVSKQNKTSDQYAHQLLEMIANYLALNNRQLKAA